ncbi:MAG TPA: hypothetical protein VNN80_10060, partial [Polyangiaceae bacterium]|nr:hypothetical protein [Polyangiaceae bacterium]
MKQHPRARRSLAIAALGAGVACQASTRAPSSAPPPPPAYGVPSPPARAPFEAYAVPNAPAYVGSAWLFLPGNASQQLVNFATVNGQAVLEGDIMLGPATALPFRYGVPWPASADTKSAVAV